MNKRIAKKKLDKRKRIAIKRIVNKRINKSNKKRLTSREMHEEIKRVNRQAKIYISFLKFSLTYGKIIKDLPTIPMPLSFSRSEFESVAKLPSNEGNVESSTKQMKLETLPKMN